MKEEVVEDYLVSRLQSRGFLVLKLVTPGHNGTPDRLILCPIWAPGPPYVVECKRPRKTERRLQELVRNNWRSRGVRFLDLCDSLQRVDAIFDQLMLEAQSRVGAADVY